MNRLEQVMLATDEAVRVARERWEINNRVIGVEEARRNKMKALEESMLKWEPRDMRIQDSRNSVHYDFDISPENGNLYLGTQLRVVSRRAAVGEITFGIYVTSNMGDFEDYNKLVERYNNQLSDGEHDPVTGDFTPAARPVKEYWPEAQHPTGGEFNPNFSDELPGVPKPVDEKVCVATVTTRLDIINLNFELTFLVKNGNNELLLWGSHTDDDLSVVSRRAIQAIFGNPRISDAGDPLEGLPMLLRGQKVKYIESSIPAWGNGTIKEPKRNQAYEALTFLSWMFSKMVPAVQAVFGSYMLLQAVFGNPDMFIPALLVGVLAPMISMFCGRVFNALAYAQSRSL